MQKIDTARGVNSHNVVPASFSCQRTSILSTTSDWIVSPPGGARQRFGAAAAKTVFCNKKPGVERRADPPILRAILPASRADVLDARILSTRCLYPNSPLI